LGEYKKHPNHVAAFDSDGNQIGIIFETAPPAQTPMMMESLVDLTRNRLLDEDIHPLLTIADFVLRFLAIHPFQDGNGRLARVLTNLVLMRSGYDYIQYSSHERVVEANKDQYYLALRESQKKLKLDTDFELSWLEFFLEMLIEQKNHLMEKSSGKDGRAKYRRCRKKFCTWPGNTAASALHSFQKSSRQIAIR
jgi:Fic family protein